MGANGSKLSSHEQAVFDIKVTRDGIAKYQKRISHLSATEHERAKAFLASSDTKRAKAALRRKRYYESIVLKCIAQTEQLEQLLDNLDQARFQKAVLSSIQQGTKALGQIQREMGGVEAVERMMEQNADAIADEQKISELLGGKLSYQDDEIDEEFERMEAEAAKAKAERTRIPDLLPDSSVPNAPMPDAPITEPRPEDGVSERTRRKEERQMLAA